MCIDTPIPLRNHAFSLTPCHWLTPCGEKECCMGFPVSIMVLVVHMLSVVLWSICLYLRLVSTKVAEPFEELNGPGTNLKENTGRTVNGIRIHLEIHLVIFFPLMYRHYTWFYYKFNGHFIRNMLIKAHACGVVQRLWLLQNGTKK